MTNPGRELALRIAGHFGPPVDAIVSRPRFVPMPQQPYPQSSGVDR